MCNKQPESGLWEWEQFQIRYRPRNLSQFEVYFDEDSTSYDYHLSFIYDYYSFIRIAMTSLNVSFFGTWLYPVRI